MPPVETSVKNVKRKKPLSCAECRRLKLKCELIFPCNHCVKRGLASICPEGELVNGSRRTKILASTEDLHKRIASLEEALKVATSSRHPLLENSLYANRKEVKSRSPPPPNRESTSRESPDTLPSISHLQLGDDPHTSRYYGAASSVYFSKHYLPPSSNHSSSPAGSSTIYDFSSPSDFSDLFPPYSRVPRLEMKEIMATFLPPPEVALPIAVTYYQTFGWFTNIVQRHVWDEYLFPHIYRDPSAIEPGPVKPQWLALSLLLLAAGALMDLSRPPHNELARQCFNGARACLLLDSSHSMTYVQCIFLYGLYLMNGGTDVSGGDTFWPLLRMGMGICEAIGLHRDGSHWNLNTSLERRIVFWEIHGMDVLQSVSLGRGQCINDSSIDVEIPISTESDLNGFHAKTYELTKIWSQINERQARVKPWIYSEVREIDQMIITFQDGLPYHLSPVVPPSSDDLIDPIRHKEAFQRNMLLLYINEARLTLHRGWFIRTLKESPIEPLSSPLKQSYLSCLEACRAIVSLVRNMIVLQGQLIHRRWHFFFHLFGACVCLAAAVIRAPTSSLARTVLAELESGVALFRMTEREELETVERLREKATRAIQHSGSTTPSKYHEGGSSEDLDFDLLGEGTTLTRATSSIPRAGAGLPSRSMEYPNHNIDEQEEREEEDEETNISYLYNQPTTYPTLPLIDNVGSLDSFGPTNKVDNDEGHGIIDMNSDPFSGPLSTSLDEQSLNAVNLEWDDFDMNAFLQEIGVL
ncbi:uncharacterized protein I206_106330 [Kwoniella pini CBS 10737]|uniref:Zn(2)-C6 fungal-type domain-containing protein n=1 Tax=Kwoniella pini CBS 10737 TaxID=1296096 RepID=A0AAJ8MST0_9TREE